VRSLVVNKNYLRMLIDTRVIKIDHRVLAVSHFRYAHSGSERLKQGDQIGRLFTLASFMKITKVAQIFGVSLVRYKS
jgi:hypothetical protein